MQSMIGSDANKLALLKKQEDMLDMLSLRFSETQEYNAGDYTLHFNGIYDGLYRFIKKKSAGGWDDTAVEQVSLTSILKQQADGIATLSEQYSNLENSQVIVRRGSFQLQSFSAGASGYLQVDTDVEVPKGYTVVGMWLNTVAISANNGLQITLLSAITGQIAFEYYAPNATNGSPVTVYISCAKI